MEKMLSLLVSLGLLAVFVSAQLAVKGGQVIKGGGVWHSDECVHQANVTGHCITMGVWNPLATLVHEGEKEKNAIPLIVRDGEFTYDLNKKHPGHLISHINVYNEMKSDKGSVTLTKGGVGDTFVTFLFQSERGEGYRFTITIYAMRGQNQQSYATPRPLVIYEQPRNPYHKSIYSSEGFPQKFPQKVPQEVIPEFTQEVIPEFTQEVIPEYTQEVIPEYTQEVIEEFPQPIFPTKEQIHY